MLAYHVARGHFLRAGRGVYRFARYPYSPFEPIVVAWLECGPEAVVSHETALSLHGLSDVIPQAIHLTLSRNQRSRKAPAGTILHTTLHPIAPSDRAVHPPSGVPMTSVIRTIIDVITSGTSSDEVAKAVSQLVASRPPLVEQLRVAAVQRGGVVREVVTRAIGDRSLGPRSATG
jgi:predicted transcriptional regulator of viral defense system